MAFLLPFLVQLFDPQEQQEKKKTLSVVFVLFLFVVLKEVFKKLGKTYFDFKLKCFDFKLMTLETGKDCCFTT